MPRRPAAPTRTGPLASRPSGAPPPPAAFRPASAPAGAPAAAARVAATLQLADLRLAAILSATLFAAALLAAAPLPAQRTAPALSKPLTVISGLPEGQGASLARLLAERLPSALDRPVALREMPGAGGVLAASRLSQAPSDGLTLGIFGVGASITRELAMATPYTAEELAGTMVLWESPWALITRASAPYDDLASLAAAARQGPVVFGHAGLERPSIPVVQALGLARAMGFELRRRRLDDLNPGHLREVRQTAPIVDVIAWPLADLAGWLDRPGYELKILAVLADDYPGPCAPPGKSLRAQGQAAPARRLAAVYEPAAAPPAVYWPFMEAMAAVLASPEAAALMEADCLAPAGLDPAGGPAALEAERRAQARLMDALGLIPAATD